MGALIIKELCRKLSDLKAMHFLKKITENPKLSEPAKEHMEVHRHFYRYSRGVFIGPAIKIRATDSKITLYGSLEYEDIIEEITVKTASKQKIEIDAILITGRDISDRINALGYDWELKESTGKTKNYKAKFTDTVEKDALINLINEFREDSYFLVSFNLNSNCKITTKKRLPSPSKKKPMEDEVNKRVQFCKGYIENTEQNFNMVIDEILPDFKEELPEGWKSIVLTNNYKIEKILLPKDIKDSRLLRIMAIREGRMTRTAEIDGEIIEKQYSIVV